MVLATGQGVRGPHSSQSSHSCRQTCRLHFNTVQVLVKLFVLVNLDLGIPGTGCWNLEVQGFKNNVKLWKQMQNHVV